MSLRSPNLSFVREEIARIEGRICILLDEKREMDQSINTPLKSTRSVSTPLGSTSVYSSNSSSIDDDVQPEYLQLAPVSSLSLVARLYMAKSMWVLVDCVMQHSCESRYSHSHNPKHTVTIIISL